MKRHYPKLLPSKKDVKASLKFFNLGRESAANDNVPQCVDCIYLRTCGDWFCTFHEEPPTDVCPDRETLAGVTKCCNSD